MALDGSGTYTPPAPEFPAVSGTTILASDFNAIIQDIAAALSQAIFRDGQAVFTANQSMGGFKLRDLANGSAAQDATTVLQVFTDPTFTVTAGMTISGAGDLTISVNLLNLTGSTEVSLPSNTHGVTQAISDNSTKMATTAFAQALAFQAALPTQTSATNAHLRCKGAGTAAWQEDKFTTLTVAGTLTAWTCYRFNTSAQTYNLPASPVDGDEVLLANIGTNKDNVVSGNGHNIVGPYASGASVTLNVSYGIFRFKYDATSTVWRAF